MHTDTYPAYTNLPPLKREWLANDGTILTVQAVPRTLCSSLDMLVSGVGCPSASAKILVELCSVWIKGSHSMPDWDLHAVYQSSEGIDSSSTPCLTCCYVSLACGGLSVLFLCAGDVSLCGRCFQFVLYWFRWCWDRVKRT